jgi:RNA polymerase sigma-70 factor (ECF subfamily)
MVLQRCRTLLGDEADAQEAAQVVFLQVHRYRESFRGEAAPSTWLWKTSTHVCLNQLRTRRRRREDTMEEVVLSGRDAWLDGVEIREILDRLLDGEDEITQQCVLYHFVDGMTHDEAGVLVGLGGAAVRKRIAGFRERARSRLPGVYEEAG